MILYRPCIHIVINHEKTDDCDDQLILFSIPLSNDGIHINFKPFFVLRSLPYDMLFCIFQRCGSGKKVYSSFIFPHYHDEDQTSIKRRPN